MNAAAEVHSPRTDEEPMAATREEIFRGACAAWLAFVVLMLVVLTGWSIAGELAAQALGVGSGSSLGLLPFVLGVALVVGGGVAFVVMLVALPTVWFIARRMRRVRRVGWHLAVYGALGALVGVLAVIVLALTSGGATPGETLSSWIGAVIVGSTTVSTLSGWWWGARRALKERRIVDPRSPMGLDRAFDESF